MKLEEKLKELGFTYDFDVFNSVVAILNTSFNKTESTKTKEVSTIKVTNSNLIELSDDFKEMIKNINFKKTCRRNYRLCIICI